jgi:SAP domain-containing ribonucleoprotein
MSHLKSLKVVDLKNILSKAALSAPARAPKADLISRILENHSALQVYYSLYPDHAPSTAESSKPVETSTETSVTTTPIIPQAPPHATTEDAKPTTTTNSDVEKCKRRAERFGVPLTSTPSNPTADPEMEKRKKRAERFGIPLVGTDPDKVKARAGQKRSAPAEAVDKDEEERRRKRAERFGLVM